MFGDFVKKKRLELELTLREFCRQLKDDPSNWSKIERGLLSPPGNEKKLREIARILQIKPGSEEWNKLSDFARVDAGNIPEYIKSDEEIMNMLPAFFRTVGSVKPTPEEFEELIRRLRKEEKPES